MLYLAQVQNDPQAKEIDLHLLASQNAEQAWEIGSFESIALGEDVLSANALLSHGRLILVELDEDCQVLDVRDAKDWVLGLVQKLAAALPSSCSFGEEEAMIEQWRQELTLQSQDITRRNLEIETRREQIQELEKSLKAEKELLESRWQELQKLETAD